MDNYLINTLGYKKRARIIFAEMTDLIRDVRNQGSTTKMLNAGFAELIATMCLMTGPIDSAERIQLKITGDSPDKNMIGSLEGTGNVRGFIGDAFEKSISTNIGNGSIFGKRGAVSVRRDTGDFSGYTGVTEVKYKSIAKNLEYYYVKSEQLPTYLQLFIPKNDVRVARGIMLQLLPGEPKSIIADFNDMVRSKKDLFFDPAFTIDMKNLQDKFSSDLAYMTTKPLQYQCACTRDMYYGVIFSLSPQEIDEIVRSKQVLESHCSMCGKQYLFTHEEVAGLFGIPLQEPSKQKSRGDIAR